MTKPRKFVLLSALYVAQGLPYGFFTQALPVLLRNAGLSLPAVGFAHLLTLPWALKFLWAPAVDRWSIPGVGLRRSWLLPLQGFSVVMYAVLAVFSPEENLPFVLAAFLITNVVAASQDIATDGLAVDVLEPKERGWANGVQVAGYRLGMIIGGGALLYVFESIKWFGVLLAMSAVAFICTLPVFFHQEPAHRALRARAQRPAEVLSEIVHLLQKPGAKAWAVVLLTYKTGHASATAMLRPWLVDAGYTLSDIAGILGVFGFAFGFAGAIVGGALASKMDRKRLLIWFGALEVIAVGSYLWPVWSAPSTMKVAIATSLDHFASGMATATLFALMMDACSKERAASDYTIQACLVVVATGLASAVSGVSAQALGYVGHFFAAGTLSLIGVVLAYGLLRKASVRALLDPRLD